MSKKKEKISLEEVKKIPKDLLLRIINRAKKYLKTDETMLRIFKEYDIDTCEIDYIPICFDDLDVSAKTDKGVIYLGYKLLCDGDFKDDYSYLIHEINHWAQQTTGDKPTKGSDDGNYLENPFEQEAFSNQVEYIANDKGDDEAEEYVENLLDYHEIEDKKDKKKLESVLLEKIE